MSAPSTNSWASRSSTTTARRSSGRSSARSSVPSTIRRATAPSATCAAKSITTWIPVYQDELILGFQSMIDEKWSWGVRGIYRKLHNAIDDMEITSNGILCGGEPTGVGFVMGNPGETLTVFTDTNCDGDERCVRHHRYVQGRLGAVRRGRQLRRRARLLEAEARLQGRSSS